MYAGDSGRGLGFEAGRLGFGDEEVSVLDGPSGTAVVGVTPDGLAAVVEESVMMTIKMIAVIL